MPSQWKLTIDSTLFDSHENGDSTIDGVFIGFGDRDNGTLIEETPDSIRVPFRVHIVATNAQTLADNTQDVLDTLASIAQHGATLTDEAGVEHLELNPDTVAKLGIEVTRFLGPDGARSGNIIEAVIVAEKLDSSFTQGTSTWSYQRISSGRSFCVGRIRAENRAAAVAIAAPLRSGAERPVWMPTNLRVIEDTNEFDAAAGEPQDLPDSSFRPAEEVVVFEQMPLWASADSRFDNVKKLECRFEARPRANLNQRAGNFPGLDVALTATMHFKTEYSATYDAADTDTTIVASSALPGKVLACAAAIVDEAQKRLGEGVFTLMAPLEKSVTGEDGVYQVTVTAITGGPSRVLLWEETDLYEETSQDEDVPIFDGSEWEFQRLPLCTIQHALDIVSIGGGRGYQKPVSLQRRPGAGSWKQRYIGDQPTKPMRNNDDSATQFVASYRRNYKFLRKGTGGGGINGDTGTQARSSGGPSGAGHFGGDAQSPFHHAGQFG